MGDGRDAFPKGRFPFPHLAIDSSRFSEQQLVEAILLKTPIVALHRDSLR